MDLEKLRNFSVGLESFLRDWFQDKKTLGALVKKYQKRIPQSFAKDIENFANIRNLFFHEKDVSIPPSTIILCDRIKKGMALILEIREKILIDEPDDNDNEILKKIWIFKQKTLEERIEATNEVEKQYWLFADQYLETVGTFDDKDICEEVFANVEKDIIFLLLAGLFDKEKQVRITALKNILRVGYGDLARIKDKIIERLLEMYFLTQNSNEENIIKSIFKLLDNELIFQQIIELKHHPFLYKGYFKDIKGETFQDVTFYLQDAIEKKTISLDMAGILIFRISKAECFRNILFSFLAKEDVRYKETAIILIKTINLVEAKPALLNILENHSNKKILEMTMNALIRLTHENSQIYEAIFHSRSDEVDSFKNSLKILQYQTQLQNQNQKQLSKEEKNSVENLIRKSVRHSNREIRMIAIELLTKYNLSDQLSILQNVILNDLENEVQKIAVRELANLNSFEVLEIFGHALEIEQVRPIAVSYFFSYHFNDTSIITNKLLKYIHDKNLKVQCFCVRALAKSKSKKATAELMNLIATVNKDNKTLLNALNYSLEILCIDDLDMHMEWLIQRIKKEIEWDCEWEENSLYNLWRFIRENRDKLTNNFCRIFEFIQNDLMNYSKFYQKGKALSESHYIWTVRLLRELEASQDYVDLLRRIPSLNQNIEREKVITLGELLYKNSSLKSKIIDKLEMALNDENTVEEALEAIERNQLVECIWVIQDVLENDYGDDPCIQELGEKVIKYLKNI